MGHREFRTLSLIWGDAFLRTTTSSGMTKVYDNGVCILQGHVAGGADKSATSKRKILFRTL
eukprot:SAG31_NODE_23494_length_503_cov_0.896040_2_plen_60_part_01